MSKKQLTLDILRKYVEPYIGKTRQDPFFRDAMHYQLYISREDYKRLAPNGWCPDVEGFNLWSNDIPSGEMILKEPGYGSQLKTVKSTLEKGQ